MDLIQQDIHCPYCGETLHISLDPSELQDEPVSQYIEDCQVCCKPIQMILEVSLSGEFSITATSDQ